MRTRKKPNDRFFPNMAKKNILWKGNGITIFGMGLIIVTIVCLFVLIQIFIMFHKSTTHQQATDSLSDSVAVFMSSDGEGYNDAYNETVNLANKLNTYTGVNVGAVAISPEQISSNNTVDVYTLSPQAALQYGGGLMPYTLNSESATQFSHRKSSLRDQIVAYALSWVGIIRYPDIDAFGDNFNAPQGIGIRRLDCSNFMHYVYGQFGIYAPAGSDAYKYPGIIGVTVDRADIKPGDLLAWSGTYQDDKGRTKTDTTAHVGMYIGGGMCCHSSYSAGGVTTSFSFEHVGGPLTYIIRPYALIGVE